MKRKPKLDLIEVLDYTLNLIQMQESKKKYEVPSFTRWVDKVIKENKTLPRVRNGYEKNRNTTNVDEAVQTSTTSNATSD